MERATSATDDQTICFTKKGKEIFFLLPYDDDVSMITHERFFFLLLDHRYRFPNSAAATAAATPQIAHDVQVIISTSQKGKAQIFCFFLSKEISIVFVFVFRFGAEGEKAETESEIEEEFCKRTEEQEETKIQNRVTKRETNAFPHSYSERWFV